MAEKELDRLLDLAQREPGYRPEFFRILFESLVFGLVPAPGFGPPDNIVRFVMWQDPFGHNILPIFSNSVRVKRVVTEGTKAYGINGRALLEATRGAIFVLNPNEQASCRLTPEDVSSLLDAGTTAQRKPVHFVTSDYLAMRAPTSPPAPLIASLTVLYSRLPSVQRAFLVELRNTQSDDGPTLLIGIEVDPQSERDRVVRETATVIEDVGGAGDHLDLCLFEGAGDPIFEGMQMLVDPFYQRSWGSKLASDAVGGRA